MDLGEYLCSERLRDQMIMRLRNVRQEIYEIEALEQEES